jgi:hypothetical protein
MSWGPSTAESLAASVSDRHTEQVSSAPSPPPLPPRPGAPGKAQGAKKEGRTGKSKPGSFVKQLKPTIITAVMLVVLLVAYLGVRSAREKVAPPASMAHTLPSSLGEIKLELPYRWKTAGQGNVAGGGSRYAVGPAGARSQALFVTRYPLRRAPRSQRERLQILAEAQASLRATGAPRTGKAKTVKLAGKSAWRFHYRRGDLDVMVHLLLLEDKPAVLYQFSCQSQAGQAGAKLRRGCREALKSAELP